MENLNEFSGGRISGSVLRIVINEYALTAKGNFLPTVCRIEPGFCDIRGFLYSLFSLF